MIIVMIIKLGQSRRGLPTSFVSIKIYIIKKKKAGLALRTICCLKKVFLFLLVFLLQIYTHTNLAGKKKP